MDPIYQALAEVTANSESAALCTVVKSEGSTPRHVGSKMLVYADGHFIGTVGGGDLEHRVMDEAWMAMGDGAARLLHEIMSGQRPVTPALSTEAAAEIALLQAIADELAPAPGGSLRR